MKAGELLRKFRADLVKYYLRDDNEDIIPTPPELYEGIITQAHWDEFIASHTTEEFVARSEKNKESATSMTYRFRRGRQS